MEVKLYLSVAYAADAFDQASWFVLFLPLADDVLEFRPWRHAEGGLVDGLIASIEFRDDEMASRPEREHPGCVSVMVRA